MQYSAALSGLLSRCFLRGFSLMFRIAPARAISVAAYSPKPAFLSSATSAFSTAASDP